MIRIVCKECNKTLNLVELYSTLRNGNRDVTCECGNLLIPKWKEW